MRRVAAVLVLLAVIVLAACGGSSEPTNAEYAKEFGPINERIEAIGTQIGEAVTSARGRTDAELERDFNGLFEQAEGAASDLQRLDAPADLQDDQDALVKALNAGARDLDSIASAAQSGDAAGAAAATAKLAADSPAIRTAREKIERTLGAAATES